MIANLQKRSSQRVLNVRRLERCFITLVDEFINENRMTIYMNLIRLYSTNKVEFSNIVFL
jgi:hypothetical protein